MIDSRPVPETLLGQRRTGQTTESTLSILYARACPFAAMVATALWWIAWYVHRVGAVQTRSKSPELCACSRALGKHARRSLRHECYAMHDCYERVALCAQLLRSANRGAMPTPRESRVVQRWVLPV